MTLAYFSVGAVLLCLVGLNILWPWIQPTDISYLPKGKLDILSQFQKLVQDREMVLENLKDLRLEHDLKKISKSDYEKMKKDYLYNAALVYRNLDVLEQEHPVFRAIDEDLKRLG